MRTLFYSVLFLLASVTIFGQAPVLTGIFGPSSACSFSPASPAYSVSALNAPTNFVWWTMPSGPFVTNTGPVAPIVFPNTNLTYTIYCFATNASGPSNTVSIVVTVYESPTVSFSGNAFVCQGSSTFFSASPTILYSASSSLSYNWSPSTGLNTTTGPVVNASPTVTTTYTVQVALGPCANTYQVTAFVTQPPVVSVSSSASVICEGETAMLNITGDATMYYLNFVPTVQSLPVSPLVTTNYTVSGTKNGCQTYTVFTQNVDACVGIRLHDNSANDLLRIYPNPSNGSFILSSQSDEKVTVRNELGQVVKEIRLLPNEPLEIHELPPGIYIVATRFTKSRVVVTP